MKEELIRPDELVTENYKLFEEDLKELMDKRDEFVFGDCPACNDKRKVVAFEKMGFTYVECEKCLTVFMNPRPNFQSLVKYFSESRCIKHWNKKIFPATESFRREKIFQPRVKKVVELCNKYKVKTDLMVEVGAGLGIFCEEMKKMNLFKRVVAIEPSSGLLENYQKKQIEFVNCPIEDVNLYGVDVLVNFELIAHLFSPKKFLLHCYEMLIEGGLIILTTPNFKGFDLKLLREKSNNIDPNFQCFFNTESIEFLLKECGFEIIEKSTPGRLDAELVRKKIISGEFDISNNLFLKDVLIDKWNEIGESFQTFLAENGLSSHLWVVGKKIKN